MTLTDKLKILDDKIKTNQAQYGLDWEAAKISALSSKELDEYFVPNTQFGQLINMTPNSLTMLNTKKYRVFIHWSMVYWSK